MSGLYDFSTGVEAAGEAAAAAASTSDKAAAVPVGWSAAARKLAPAVRKRAAPLPHRAVASFSAAASLAPSLAQSLSKRNAPPPTPQRIQVQKTDKDDEYDPNKPNEFDLLVRDRKIRRKLARKMPHIKDQPTTTSQSRLSESNSIDSLASTHQRLSQPPALLLNQNSNQSGVSHDRKEESEEEEDDEDVDGIPLNTALLQQQQPSRPAAAPASIIQVNESGDDAYLRRMQMSSVPTSQPPPVHPYAAQPPTSSGDAALQKRLEMLKSRVASKLPDLLDSQRRHDLQPPTRVVLLLNMVGPGEVDDDLESETAGECCKFGEVEKVRVFEVRGGQTVREDEAVRIFVKFRNLEAAVEAKSKMDGRFFGGRNISAVYFDESRFDAGNLKP
ncbi:hypothetical protein HDU98_007351 [Podochytrium sp. JEL0797]|nr:hypothetical protein HDU98_007351 [Podochytrium sp. JEL0797]